MPLRNCQYKGRRAEALMRRAGMPYLDASNKSMEEQAVLHEAKLEQKIYWPARVTRPAKHKA